MEESTSSSAKTKVKIEEDKSYSEMSSVSFDVNDAAMLAPVEIEVLDTTAINQFDMGEFVQTEAIKIHQIPDKLSVKYMERSQPEENASDAEEQCVLSTEEENLLTKQFLNGELTFSEFTVRMDRDADIEQEEPAVSAETESQSTPEVDSSQQPDQSNVQKPPKPRPKRIKRNLPPALQGLMGEANLRYARGEVQLAIQICMEIIRQVPNAPEPYKTLSMIYEVEQPDKSMQCALIAAHLSPRDAEQWTRLATSSLEVGNLRQALTCYSKAIQASPKNIELYEIRAQLQDQYGDRKAYIRAYSKLLNQLGPEDGEDIVKYAKKLLDFCTKENMFEVALEGMDNLFRKCPQYVSLEEVNLMMDLLIGQKQFNRCLEILASFTPIRLEYADDGEQEVPDTSSDKRNNKLNKGPQRSVISCFVPDDLAVDLKAKCIVAMIELGQIPVADDLVARFRILEDVELSGDLYLDVAEAYMGKGCFDRGLELLERLVTSQNYSLAAVWLRHAECWLGCGDARKAIQSYERVRQLSPQHLAARLELARLYEAEGELLEAIEALNLGPEELAQPGMLLDPGVVYRRAILLGQCGPERQREYFEAGLLLFSRHCVKLRSRQELAMLSRTTLFKQRHEIIQRNRLSRGEPLQEEDAPTFSNENEPSEPEEFGLLLEMCERACAAGKYGLLQRLCFTGLTSRRFAARNGHLLYMCLIACVRNGDAFAGFNIVREFVRSNRDNSSVPWNLLNVIIQKATDSRHSRFIMRQLSNENVFSGLHILHANNCLVSGTYKYALNDYISLFKVRPNPLLALLISVTLLQMACQKFSSKKNQLVAQALAFMRTYAKLRDEQGQQESNYNTARALHQLGLLTGAIHFYKQVLESPQPTLVREHENLLDLRKEAAFNLHLIYMLSGNQELARMYIEEHIVI